MRIVHARSDYPAKMVFWCFDSPEKLIARIRAVGFSPKGSLAAMPPREIMPVRWAAIVFAVAVWDGLFLLDNPEPLKPGAELGWPSLLAVGLLCAAAWALPQSQYLQSLALKPGRSVHELKSFVGLLRLLSTILLIAFYPSSGVQMKLPGLQGAPVGRVSLCEARRQAPALCIRGVTVLEKTLNKAIALLRGGGSTFNGPEMLLLESTLKELPDQDAQIFSKQIASVSLVQRQHPRRLVAAYYPKNKHVPPLPYGGYEYCLAKVSYRVNGKTKTTNLVLHDGRFMTFERNVPLKSDNIESITKVALHPDGYEPVAEEIDGEEHSENA